MCKEKLHPYGHRGEHGWRLPERAQLCLVSEVPFLLLSKVTLPHRGDVESPINCSSGQREGRPVTIIAQNSAHLESCRDPFLHKLRKPRLDCPPNHAASRACLRGRPALLSPPPFTFLFLSHGSRKEQRQGTSLNDRLRGSGISWPLTRQLWVTIKGQDLASGHTGSSLSSATYPAV